MFSEEVIQRVRDSADIVDLVSGYVHLKKTGKNFVGLCPFHAEKTPSFTVNPDKQIFHCFGCGSGGNVFKFLELQEGLTFPEAMRRLAERAGILLTEDRRSREEAKRAGDERQQLLAVMAEADAFFRAELDSPAGTPARAYLSRRGVNEAMVKAFSLGFARPDWDSLLRHLKQKGHAPALLERAGLIVKRSEGEGYYDRFRGRIIFPIRDLSGKVIAFGGRVLDDALPKYLNSPETALYSKSNTLYCFDLAKDQARKLGYFVIVEGYLDALACHQFGIQNAVATLGTALTEGHLRLMRRFCQKLVLIFDPDPAGVKAAMRGLDLFLGSGMKVNVVSLPGGDDPDTFLQKRGSEAFRSELRRSVKLMDFVFNQVVRSRPAASIDEKVERAGEMLGFIAKIPSSIERDYYLKQTAEVLEVDEGLLRQETTKQPPAPGFRQREAAAPTISRRPKAEEILIHLMLRNEETARHVREEIGPEDFTDPLLRRAAERICAVLDERGTLEADVLLSGDDEELSRLIAHYVVLDVEYADQDKTRTDCLHRIRQQAHTKRMKSLDAAIKEAAARGDSEAFQRLMQEQQQLLRSRPVQGGTAVS